jgi:hypothetical protein
VGKKKWTIGNLRRFLTVWNVSCVHFAVVWGGFSGIGAEGEQGFGA